jgi:hydrogenase/urease accessory protein HupE
VIFLAAHIVQTGWSVFYDGAAHVWSTPSDLLAALAVGLLAGLRGASRWTLIALPSAWVAGGVLGAQDPSGGILPLASAISVTLCGCLAAMDLALPRSLLAVLAGAVGGLHGYANGATLSHGRSVPMLVSGAALAALAIATMANVLVATSRAPWQRIAARVAGSWIAATGLLLIGWQLRGPS